MNIRLILKGPDPEQEITTPAVRLQSFRPDIATLGFRNLGCRVSGVEFRLWGLGFRGLGVWGFRVWGL